MDTSSPILTPPPTQAPTTMEQSTPQSNGSLTKLVMLVVVVLLVGAGVVAFMRMKKTQPVLQQGTPAPGQEFLIDEMEVLEDPAPVAISEVTLKAPVANAVVQSPLLVSGIVPPGWMFEGVVGIELQDENKQVVAQVPGAEVQPGDWQKGYPVEFRGELTFTTTAKTGFLIIKKDNPSGLPENDGSFSIPVKFN